MARIFESPRQCFRMTRICALIGKFRADLYEFPEDRRRVSKAPRQPRMEPVCELNTRHAPSRPPRLSCLARTCRHSRLWRTWMALPDTALHAQFKLHLDSRAAANHPQD